MSCLPLCSSLGHVLATEAQGSLAAICITAEALLKGGVSMSAVLFVQLHHIGRPQICRGTAQPQHRLTTCSLPVPVRRSKIDRQFRLPALLSCQNHSGSGWKPLLLFCSITLNAWKLVHQIARPQGTTPKTGWQKLRKYLCQHPPHPRNLRLR